MQVFRLVQSGYVDKVIAFDELPKRFLDGVDMQSPSGLPKAWKGFIGDHTRVTPGMIEKNQFTQKLEKIGGETITAPFFFILYYKEINKDMERWQEISSFVRRAVDLKFRLLDKLEDMALPMGIDAMSELKLEPEDLETNGAIIPIPVEYQEKSAPILDANGAETVVVTPLLENEVKCGKCDALFKNERAARMHSYRKHEYKKKEKEPVTA